MGQQVSLLRFGQRVRIMQTDEMVEIGYANRYGTIAGDMRTPAHMVLVALDGLPNAPEGTILVAASSVMRAKTAEAAGGEV